MDQSVPGERQHRHDDRRVQQRQLRSHRPGLSRRRRHQRQPYQRPADRKPPRAAGHAALGHQMEGGERGMVCAFLHACRPRARAIRTATIISISIPSTQDAFGLPLAAHDLRLARQRHEDVGVLHEEDRRDRQGDRRDHRRAGGAAQEPVRYPRLPEHARHRRHADGRRPQEPASYRRTCSTGTRRTCSSSAPPSIRTMPATTRPRSSPRWHCGSATTSRATSTGRACCRARPGTVAPLPAYPPL